MLSFVKMHGIGNDYIYLDVRDRMPENIPELARRMSDRHFGCGADGLILIGRSDRADFRMRMFNADGSDGGMCGNGLRCVARYCHDLGLTDKTVFTVEAGGGIKTVTLTLDNQGRTRLVRASMGVPELDGEKIPSTVKGCPVIGHKITVNGREYAFTLVNMGNPHAVCFVPDTASAPVTEDGPLVECHPDFPARTNVEFIQVLDRSHIRMRVWERGTGETLACGTGACASAVACVLNGLTDRAVAVELPGGTLNIEWTKEGPVDQQGPAEFVYFGQWPGEGEILC